MHRGIGRTGSQRGPVDAFGVVPVLLEGVHQERHHGRIGHQYGLRPVGALRQHRHRTVEDHQAGEVGGQRPDRAAESGDLRGVVDRGRVEPGRRLVDRPDAAAPAQVGTGVVEHVRDDAGRTGASRLHGHGLVRVLPREAGQQRADLRHTLDMLHPSRHIEVARGAFVGPDEFVQAVRQPLGLLEQPDPLRPQVRRHLVGERPRAHGHVRRVQGVRHQQAEADQRLQRAPVRRVHLGGPDPAALAQHREVELPGGLVRQYRVQHLGGPGDRRGRRLIRRHGRPASASRAGRGSGLRSGRAAGRCGRRRCVRSDRGGWRRRAG